MLRRITSLRSCIVHKQVLSKKKPSSWRRPTLKTNISKSLNTYQFNNYCLGKKLKIHEDIEETLKSKFNVQAMNVMDTSGRGSFFQIEIIAPEFEGLNTLQKHKLVHEALHEQIPQIHGIQIRARAPEK